MSTVPHVDTCVQINSIEEADKKMQELASQGKIDPAFLQVQVLSPHLISTCIMSCKYVCDHVQQRIFMRFLLTTDTTALPR